MQSSFLMNGPAQEMKLKLNNISTTPKMVKKVIKNFDSSKTSGPDCIPVVVVLISWTLLTGAGSGLLTSVMEKLNWFHLTRLITLVLLMWKRMCLFLRKNHLLRCWGWPSLTNWVGALTLFPLLKLLPRKLEPWFVLWSFFLLMLLCISINHTAMHGILLPCLC